MIPNQTDLDAKMADVLASEATRQEADLQANGVYTRLIDEPVAIAFPGTLNYSVNTLDGPWGHAYEVVARYALNGQTWTRTDACPACPGYAWRDESWLPLSTIL